MRKRIARHLKRNRKIPTKVTDKKDEAIKRGYKSELEICLYGCKMSTFKFLIRKNIKLGYYKNVWERKRNITLIELSC